MLRPFAEIEESELELFWLAGLLRSENDQWRVRTVLRGLASGAFYNCNLAIGTLPILAPGKTFSNGKMTPLRNSGHVNSFIIPDVSNCREITSSEIPPQIYRFPGKRGFQRLFLYHTTEADIFIPTIELVRYLFLHNRTLANALMRPGALNRLFHPAIPGSYPEFHLRFTAEMPKVCLSQAFVREFAWIALDPSARRAWDSVALRSTNHRYVSLSPPKILNSTWTFRGLQHGRQWLILELIHVTGKIHPCQRLTYDHPKVSKPISTDPGSVTADVKDSGLVDDETEIVREEIKYDFRLDNGERGSQSDSGQKLLAMNAKPSSFHNYVPVYKVTGVSESSGEGSANGQASKVKTLRKRQTLSVSQGERDSDSAALPPLEFKQLTVAGEDCLKAFQAFAKTMRTLANLLPKLRISMSPCLLKGGRKFSNVNREPRVAFVALIVVKEKPPIVLLEVDRSGDIILSMMALRFKKNPGFPLLEEKVERVLDVLVDNGGHWDKALETELDEIENLCACERLPKMLYPRDQANERGQSTLWAIRLIDRLRLNEFVHSRRN